MSKVQDVTGRLTNYVYDTMNRIKEVYDSGQEVASYKYYPDHMPKSVSFANGVEVNYGYDLDKNRTQATTIAPSGKVLLEHSYGYDGNGNQLWKQESQEKTSYTYDRVNRLAAVNYPKRGKECFTYDLASNRTTRQLEDTIETYTYNAKNQLMAWHTNQESTTYQYDKQGHLLSEQGLGGMRTYEYDGFNRTVGAHLPNGGTLVHRYDPEGLRAEVEENGKLRKFLFSGQNIIAELDQEDQVTTRFIRGSELLAQDDANNQRYYYHLNEHGNVTHLLDGKANVVNCYEYDAFGNTVESKEEVYNPFRYAGEQYDTATGQYYLRARFYNPVIARFTQEDVYRGDGLNLYIYVSNNPVKYVDPSGYKQCKVDAVQGTGTPVEVKNNGAEVESKFRRGSLRDIKRQLDISTSQQPIKQKRVFLKDMKGNRIFNKNNQAIMSRELTYEVNGKKIVIQDHSLGHDFGGIGNQPPHHNVRPFENTDTGKVQGMEKHYYFNKRNRK